MGSKHCDLENLVGNMYDESSDTYAAINARLLNFLNHTVWATLTKIPGRKVEIQLDETSLKQIAMFIWIPG